MNLEQTETTRRPSPWRRWWKKLIKGVSGARDRVARRAGSVASVGRRARDLAEEKRSNRFPESEHGIVQLVLFVWGCLPALGSAFRERILRRHKRSARSGARVRGRLEELSLHPAAFLVGAMVIAAAAVALSLYTVGTAVSYGGTELGTVSGQRRFSSGRPPILTMSTGSTDRITSGSAV